MCRSRGSPNWTTSRFRWYIGRRIGNHKQHHTIGPSRHNSRYHPKKGDCKFHSWQVAVFINQEQWVPLCCPFSFRRKHQMRPERPPQWPPRTKPASLSDNKPFPKPQKKKPLRAQIVYFRDAKSERNRYSQRIKPQSESDPPRGVKMIVFFQALLLSIVAC